MCTHVEQQDLVAEEAPARVARAGMLTLALMTQRSRSRHRRLCKDVVLEAPTLHRTGC